MAASPMRVRHQIASANDLQGVVRAMRAQAAASIAQYERSVVAAAAYAATIETGLGAVLRDMRRPEVPQPSARVKSSRPARVVVFGSDQGLVGRFNEIVAELAARSMPTLAGRARIWPVGDRVRVALEGAGFSLEPVLPVPASVQGITALVTALLSNLFEARGPRPDADEEAPLHLFYNRPVPGSASTFEPVLKRLLPLDDTWRRGLLDRKWPRAARPEMIAAADATLRALIREHLFISLFQACADSLASENASRLAAMDRADSNIDKLLVRLQGSFHRLRQGRIDEELSDVTAGFRALRAPSAS